MSDANSRAECGCSLCTPEEYEAAPRTHPSGLRVVGDYPSLWAPPHFEPTRFLLDTCVIQQFLWARERAPTLTDELSWRRVDQRYGGVMGRELRALAGLLAAVNPMPDDHPFPFVVGRTSWDEFLAARAHRARALCGEWRHWRARAQTIGEGLEPVPDPRFTVMPEEIGWPTIGQLRLAGVGGERAVPLVAGPFPNEGDRRLIAEAKSLGLDAILTTDMRTFWRHREFLYRDGLEIWRPSDLCWAWWNTVLQFRGDGMVPTWPVGPLAEAPQQR